MLIREKGIQTLSKKLFDGKGEALIEPLFMPDEFESAVRFCARVTLEPGCSIGLHQHTEEDELYFIIEGAGEAADEDGKYPVSAGHSILTRSGESHSIENTGSCDLVLIAVIPQVHIQ